MTFPKIIKLLLRISLVICFFLSAYCQIVQASYKDKDIHRALLKQIRCGDIYMFNFLIDTYAIDINASKNLAARLLHCAALYGQEEMIKLLIDTYKVDKDVRDAFGEHALHVASLLGEEGVIKLLLDTYKVDKDVRDARGRHALHYAARYGQEGVIKLLLDTYKVDIHITNNEKETALHCAARQCRESTYDFLVHLGANEEAKDKDRQTPKDLKERRCSHDYFFPKTSNTNDHIQSQ